MDSDNPESLPRPTVDKSSLVDTDLCYENLIELINKEISKPIRDDWNKKQIEKEKKEKLINILKDKYGSRITIHEEYSLGKNLKSIKNNKADIRASIDNKLYYFELKSKNSEPKIIAQISKYYLLSRCDGEVIDEFIIVSEYNSPELKEDLANVGQACGLKITMKTWYDYGIE